VAQVNFNISDNLKEELDKLMNQSGAATKPKFMEQMVMVFNAHLANSINVDIDLSKYEHVNWNDPYFIDTKLVSNTSSFSMSE